MISEGSCEDWNNDAGNVFTEINCILKYIRIKKTIILWDKRYTYDTFKK